MFLFLTKFKTFLPDCCTKMLLSDFYFYLIFVRPSKVHFSNRQEMKLFWEHDSFRFPLRLRVVGSCWLQLIQTDFIHLQVRLVNSWGSNNGQDHLFQHLRHVGTVTKTRWRWFLMRGVSHSCFQPHVANVTHGYRQLSDSAPQKPASWCHDGVEILQLSPHLSFSRPQARIGVRQRWGGAQLASRGIKMVFGRLQMNVSQSVGWKHVWALTGNFSNRRHEAGTCDA